MAVSVKVDAKQVEKKLAELFQKSAGAALKASGNVADEVLRLSQSEVPHDIGLLQNSGHVEPESGGHVVGYNKVYAARLHEHPEYRFQKGRKGKFLEDPIKYNLSRLVEFVAREIRAIL